MNSQEFDKLNMSLDDIIKNDRNLVNGSSDAVEAPNNENNNSHLDFQVSRTHLSNFYARPEQQNRNYQNHRYFQQNPGRRYRGPPQGDPHFRNYRYNSNRPYRYNGRRDHFYRNAFQNTINNQSSDLYHNQNWRGRNMEMPLTRQSLEEFNYSTNDCNGDRMRRSQSVLSNHSIHSNYSRRSNRSNHSHRSNYSNMSLRSNNSGMSHYSNKSYMSNRSGRGGSWYRHNNSRPYFMRNPLDYHIQEEIKNIQEGSKHNRSNSPLSLEKIYNFKTTPDKTEILMTNRFLSYYQR